MAVEHRTPTDATIKELYANALGCAVPQCPRPLFTIGAAGQRSLNSRVAHICARSEHGPRWDPVMTEAENRASANLIVLCVEHASAVDLPQRLQEFTVEVLRGWKQRQLDEFDAAVAARGAASAGWILTPEEVADVRRSSESTTISFQAETMFFGGMGGAAIGGGGGGGAAIGPGALGGSGGPAGTINLDGTDGLAPGAGGGGGAWMAPNALSSEPISISGDLMGSGNSSGLDGEDGGDTVLLIGDSELRAAGGVGGLAGTGVRGSTRQVRVSTLTLHRYSEWADTATIVGAGIQWYSVLNIPTSLAASVFIVFEAGGVDDGEYTVAVEAINPLGERRGRVRFPLTVERAGALVRITRGCDINIHVDTYGLWAIVVRASDAEPVTHQFVVKRYGEG